MSDGNKIKRTDELVVYEKKEIESINFFNLRKDLLNTGPLNIIQIVAHFKQYDPTADINTVEQQLSLWPHFFRKLDSGLWEGIPIERSTYKKPDTGYTANNRSGNKPNKRKYKPRPYPQPANDQRVYKDKNDSHFLVIESDTYKRIGPYLKVEAQSVTTKEKDILTELSGKDDLLKVFLKNKDKYMFLGHRSIMNHDESPDGHALTLKFAPANDDLSIYQIEDKSTGLLEQTDQHRFALALPFEIPEPLPNQIIEKLNTDYKPSGTNFQLFRDRYTHELSKLNKKEISAEEFLHWLAEEKVNASQADYEKILSDLVLKNDFKNRHQLLEIAIECVNDESSVKFCNDFLDLIVKNKNADHDFKSKGICFVDVMLLYPEKLEKKHYKKIAKAYSQNGEYDSGIRYYAEAYRDGIKSSDIDYEFHESLEKSDSDSVEEYIEVLLNAGLVKAFEDKINKSNEDEIFDLVISFYQFYKDKVKPDQEDLESFASSVLSICSINNEWDNFDLFYDDIDAREKFMKKPEKKFDLLSVGEMASLKEFIDALSGKYLTVINKNFKKVTASLKSELVEQIRIFELLMENTESPLSNWIKNTIEESETKAQPVKTVDILKGFKKFFIIGGIDEGRKMMMKKLLGLGADKVHGEPPMSERNIDKKTLRAKMEACDCIVFITSYMGHMEYYMGKDIANELGIQIIHCHGGISRLLVEIGKLRK